MTVWLALKKYGVLIKKTATLQVLPGHKPVKMSPCVVANYFLM